MPPFIQTRTLIMTRTELNWLLLRLSIDCEYRNRQICLHKSLNSDREISRSFEKVTTYTVRAMMELIYHHAFDTATPCVHVCMRVLEGCAQARMCTSAHASALVELKSHES